MDDIGSGKKQRQRNQKDRRKNQEKQTESASPAATTASNVSDPLPQRNNRRQRNEAISTSANKINTNQPENADAKPTEKENVTIDFSNLKRETEEITKLTKKFAKRNICSNWHRYSAPEGSESDVKTEEELPADFSALIQVPASKGGHLQLKDEQEWSSASNEQLGGYFALNLKLLNQSLACIPIYEQLRLPKYLFTEDELKHFDNVASEARKLYNPDEIEDANELVQRALTNLLKEETDSVVDHETKKDIGTRPSNDIHILSAQENNHKLLGIDLQCKTVSENSSAEICYLPKDGEGSSDKNNTPLNIINKEEGKTREISDKNLNSNKSLEGISNDIFPILSSVTVSKKSETEIQPSLLYKNSKITDETKCFTKVANETAIHTKEIVQTNKSNSECTTINNPKNHSKHDRKTPIKEVGGNKLNNTDNSLKLEDDDDLDFLLSLKKSVLPENKSKTVPNKDSKVLPENRRPYQDSSKQENLELDDWLDSVLQD